MADILTFLAELANVSLRAVTDVLFTADSTILARDAAIA
jgi:hypothetical protein